MPVGGKTVQQKFDDRPIGGGLNVQPKIEPETSGGMAMNFDFSDPKPKVKKSKFLKRGTGVDRIKKGPQKAANKMEVEPNEEDEVEQKMSTKANPLKSVKAQSPKKFLKRGDTIKYDPMKAVKEEKLRRIAEERLKKEQHETSLRETVRMNQTGEYPSEMVSILNFGDDELVNHMSAIALDGEYLDCKMTKEDSIRLARAEGKKRLSVKSIVNRRSIDKTPAAPAVTGQFQNLNYLKKVPKRVDCWLASGTKKNSATPKNNRNKSLNSSADQADFSKTTKIFNKLPSNRYINEDNTKNFEDAKKNREEFLKKHGSPNVGKKKTFKNRRSTEKSPEMGYLNSPRTEFDGLSIDAYNMYQDDSVSQLNPVGTSMQSQDDEKLECLLERLEDSRMPEKGFTMKERTMIMEDTQYMAMLTGSETLYRIFQLMCNAQENFKNHEDALKETGAAKLPHDKRDVKMTFDLEFEKLLIMIKGQYHSLFDKRKLKDESSVGQEYNQNYEQDSESDSDYEDNQRSQKNFGYISKRTTLKTEEPIMETRSKLF
jgi:hypothetical protein